MFRLTQTIRNFFIRLEGLLYQVSNFIKSIFAKVAQFFGYLAKLLGLTDTPYFLETDPQKDVKSTTTQLNETPKTTQDTLSAANISRRPDPKMAEFLKMAQQAKNSR